MTHSNCLLWLAMYNVDMSIVNNNSKTSLVQRFCLSQGLHYRILKLQVGSPTIFFFLLVHVFTLSTEMLQWTLVPSFFYSLFLYLAYLHLIDQFKPFQLLSDGCVRGCAWVCAVCTGLIWYGRVRFVVCRCAWVYSGVYWYAWVCIGCARVYVG